MKIQRREFLATSLVGVGEVMMGTELYAAGTGKIKTFDPYEKVRLGRTHLKLSRLGLGTGMRGWNGQSNQTRMGKKKLEKLIRGCYERGISWFDMADLYGTHPYVLPALKGIPRDKYSLVSKIWFRPTGILAKDRPGAEAVVHRFLKEIGTDYLDLVLIHCVVSEKWNKEKQDYMEQLEKLKHKGVIRAHGVSCHSLKALKTAISEPWVDSVHTRINPYGVKMDGKPEEVVALLQGLHKAGKGVVGMKIVGEGAFRKNPEQRSKSLDFVLNLGCVNVMAVGFEKLAEVDDLAKRIRTIPVRRKPVKV